MPENAILKMSAPPPRRGVFDGLDPGARDEYFSPEGAASLLNLRVGRGLWETRYGMSAARSIPGTGNVHFLGSVVGKDGTRYRLAARNGNLYDVAEPSANYGAVSGATLLATNLLQGVQLGSAFYFTDRAGQLRKYVITTGGGSSVAVVKQPVGPSAAPVVYPRYWGILEDWSDVSTWSQPDSPSVTLVQAGAAGTDPLPLDGHAAKITVTSAAGPQKRVYENVSAGENVQSHWIAFYFWSDDKRPWLHFEIGQNRANEYHYGINPPRAEQAYIRFCPIGGLDTLRYKRFRVANGAPPATIKVWISKLVLPGRLLGKYRWRYTHYNPTTGGESKLSPATSVQDFSRIPTSYHNETADALNKSAALQFVSDSGVDAGTTKIRIYRNGGVPALTTEPGSGREVWVKVAEVYDAATTLSGSRSAGDGTLTLASATNIAVGDLLVIDPTGDVEYRRITALAGAVATLEEPLEYAHTSGVAIKLGYLDNTANEEIDPTQQISPERDDPPTATQFVAKTQDGRLVLFGFTDNPGGVCLSNLGTPERPLDFEVFPKDVDPLTRQDLLQGFRFSIGGREGGETIAWGGMYAGLPTCLTRTSLWQITAQSQVTWGPEAIVRVLDNLGCIAPETVREVNGSLYWVTDGPRVVKWDGQSAPAIVSNLRVNKALEDAPTAYWGDWFAVPHSKRDGLYYCLCMVPQGGTTPTKWLEYNTETDVWEPVVYYDATPTALPWKTGAVYQGPGDVKELLAAHPSSGAVYRLDDPAASDDAGAPIVIQASTKRFRLPFVGALERLYLRLAGVTADTLTVGVTTDGSEYGTVTNSYAKSVAGSGDLEIKQRLKFDLQKGRYVQLTLTGSVSHRPALRELEWQVSPIRENYVSGP